MTRDCESPAYRYGKWAGNEAGVKQSPNYCVEPVYVRGEWVSSQCRFKRKYGLYCGKHKRGNA